MAGKDRRVGGLQIFLRNGYRSLIWKVPLAVPVFVWFFVAGLPSAAYLAWLSSFACIKIK